MNVSVFRAFSIEGKAFHIKMLCSTGQNMTVPDQLTDTSILILVSVKSCCELCQRHLVILFLWRPKGG